MRNFGFVGGLGPGATIHYYRELSKLNAGEFLIVQADMARMFEYIQRNDITGLAGYFARLIERMAKGGAEIAAVSAIVAHICIRELEKISVLPLVNVVDEIAAEIRARGFRRVALFGTRFVQETRMFGMLDGIEVVVPDEVLQIHDAYMSIVNGGTEGRAVLTEIAHRLPVDAVVLAGTDLALVFDETNTDFPHVDGAKVHVEAIRRKLAA